MTDALSESSRNERKMRRRAELRERYLDAMSQYLAAPNEELHTKLQSAFAFTLDCEDGLSEGVAIKFGMMLAALRKQDEKAWAQFLSIHVGFTNAKRMAEFKALSPFKDWMVVERDDHSDYTVLRGEVNAYLSAMSNELVISHRHYKISDVNKIKRTFVAIQLSEAARNRPVL